MTTSEGPPETPRTECRTPFASLLSLPSLSKTGRAEFAALLSRWDRPGEGACMSVKLACR